MKEVGLLLANRPLLLCSIADGNRSSAFPSWICFFSLLQEMLKPGNGTLEAVKAL